MLARLEFHIISISDSGVIVQNGAESSFVVEVKEKKDNDPFLFKRKCIVCN